MTDGAAPVDHRVRVLGSQGQTLARSVSHQWPIISSTQSTCAVYCGQCSEPHRHLINSFKVLIGFGPDSWDLGEDRRQSVCQL